MKHFLWFKKGKYIPLRMYLPFLFKKQSYLFLSNRFNKKGYYARYYIIFQKNTYYINSKYFNLYYISNLFIIPFAAFFPHYNTIVYINLSIFWNNFIIYSFSLSSNLSILVLFIDFLPHSWYTYVNYIFWRQKSKTLPWLKKL